MNYYSTHQFWNLVNTKFNSIEENNKLYWVHYLFHRFLYRKLSINIQIKTQNYFNSRKLILIQK